MSESWIAVISAAIGIGALIGAIAGVVFYARTTPGSDHSWPRRGAMSDNTTIEWTDATWNPVTGCTKVSPGCDHCYAETFAERWRGKAGHHFENGFDLTLRPERIDQPLRWKRPRRISMSDLFHEGIGDGYIADVFAVMARTPQHAYQLLTKRHGRMRSLLSGDLYDLMVRRLADVDIAGEEVPARGVRWPLPNVWLGVSVEDQKWADIRIPALLTTPAAVRWLSCEPLLGPIDIEQAGGHLVDWIVAGGESGPKARPMRTEWARSLRDQCIAAEVPFLFKQWGNWVAPSQMTDETFMDFESVHGCDAYDPDQPWRFDKKRAGRLLDGRTWDEYPAGGAA